MTDTNVLYVWAEEGGIELKLSRLERQIVVEIVHRSAVENVLARATMAAFRWERIAQFFVQNPDEPVTR